MIFWRFAAVLLSGVGLGLMACNLRDRTEPTEGLYRRTGASIVYENKVHPISRGDDVDVALPPSIRIEKGNVYELDARLVRIRGTYRVERDSIFFEEGEAGLRKVALLGRVIGDTLLLRLLGAGVALDAPPDAELLSRFVLAR